MKTRKILLAILTLCSLTFVAQENPKQKKKTPTIIVENGEVKTNQLVLDYLSRETKIKNNTVNQVIRNKRNMNNNIGGRVLPNNLTSHISENKTTIFIDNELAIGHLANNFHLLDNVKMKDVKKITVTEVGLDCIIYITKS